MSTKICFKCNKEKYLFEFYKHSGMEDGHLNKCRDCCKEESKQRLKFLSKNDPEFIEKERIRGREKYHRLNYKEKHKPSYEKKKEIMERYKNKYPEKTLAKNKTQRLPCAKGNHLHHWSYNLEHAKDVIELSIQDHALLHRHIQYDQERYMYRNLDGILLDSRESHIKLLEKLKINNL